MLFLDLSFQKDLAGFADMKKPEKSAIEPYFDAGYALIPLHQFIKIDREGNIRGKTPLDKFWRTAKYNQKKIQRYIDRNHNIGVRLRKSDLVIDVDPRNFPDGDDVLARFLKDTKLDLSPFPHVVTGSGGDHYYLKKPKDVLINETLADYPGLEFKSFGRQVVSAGSIHPGAGKNPRRHKAYGKYYEWDFLAPTIDQVPEVPPALLKILKRAAPERRNGGGEHSAEEIGKMLDALNPQDYSDNDSWLKLMMACHHASDGDARQEFIDWSTQDPQYSNQAWSIGRRWDSLHRKGNSSGAITFRTLHKELISHGAGEAIPRPTAADDFDDIDEEVENANFFKELHEERKPPLERMNDEFCIVNEVGKFFVYAQAQDPTYTPTRRYWERFRWNDFALLNAHRTVQKAGGKGKMPITDAWLAWPGRRQYKGVLFDPAQEHPGYLNMWRGWSVEPRKGDWSYMEQLLYECLCDGNNDANRYVLDWAADMVQRPGHAAEVAIAFQGEKGTGKGTFGRVMANICGQHGLHITSPSHLTGRFNSHIRDVICLFADEAISPVDREANSRLKALITEPTLTYEGKGVDVVRGKNLVHIIMASNEDWFVPMSLADERRFFVTKVNKLFQGNKSFFKLLYKQMKNGGMEAMLWDLLNRDIGNWRPRDDIPATAGSIDQKIRSMTPICQWWYNILYKGELPFMVDGDWYGIFDVKAFKEDVRTNFVTFCDENGIRPGYSGRSNDLIFATELHRIIGEGFRTDVKMKVPNDRTDLGAYGDGRRWAFGIPPLDQCRKNMEDQLGGSVTWQKVA
jgi:hypothetical protein